MAEVSNAFNIPHYIKASSPEGLRRLMLENNIRRGAELKYFQIVNVDGTWFAWYYDLAKEYITTLKKVK